MTVRQTRPKEFEDRINFMFMFNDMVLLQKAAGFFFEPTRETASPRALASVSLLGVAELRCPPPDLRRVCMRFFASSTTRHPPMPALFPRAGINRHRKMTSPPKLSATSQEMAWANGLRQNDRIVHPWMCKQFHHRTGCTGETWEKRSTRQH